MTQFHPRREKLFMRESFREASQIEKKKKNPCNFVDRKHQPAELFGQRKNESYLTF